MSARLSPAAARRVFLTLTFTRWFPVGLIVGITTLWPLERGLTVAETLSAAALVGITVFALELPTSGFAHVSSGITVEAFLKRTAIAHSDPAALLAMSPAIIALADHEGFSAHSAALRMRHG